MKRVAWRKGEAGGTIGRLRLFSDEELTRSKFLLDQKTGRAYLEAREGQESSCIASLKDTGFERV